MKYTSIYSFISVLRKHGHEKFIEESINDQFNGEVFKLNSISEDQSTILLKFAKTKVKIRKNDNLRDKIEDEVSMLMGEFMQTIMAHEVFNDQNDVAAALRYSNIILNKNKNTVLIKFKAQ